MGITVTPLTIEFVENTILKEYTELGISKVLKKYRIHQTTFAKFLAAHPELEQQYSFLQAFRAEVLVDDALDIADTDPDPMRARNRIDVRKWAASKFKPSKFADRIDVHTPDLINIQSALDLARSRALSVVKSAQISADETEKPLGMVSSAEELARP